jgi:site-specific DNA recombinase
LEKGKVFAAALSDESHQYAEIIRSAIEIVCLHEDRVAIQISAQGLCDILGMEFDPRLAGISLSSPIARGRGIRLVVPGEQKTKVVQRDERLVGLLAEADAARQLVLDQPNEPLSRIALTSGQCRTRLRRLLSVSFLAPSIVKDILAGAQPASLTHNQLLNFEAPLDWKQQRAALGFN